MTSLSRPLAAVSISVLALSWLGLPSAAQDWKGFGRIEGSVADEEGKPLADVAIKAGRAEGGSTTLKSDKKGRWVLGGISGGSWNLDFELSGYETLRITVVLPGESARLAPVKVSLKRSGPPPELTAAAKKADEAYKAGRYDEARAEYEKLLAMRPDLATLVHQQIGFSYVQQEQFDKALEYLEKVLAAEPGNATIRAIAAQAALETKELPRARELLAGLDESAIKNPDIFFNMGVNFLNANAPEDAIAYFGKAVTLDPAYVDGYYRRALAYLQLGKKDESRVDLEKVVELSPDSEMGQMAKKALESLR